MSGLSAEMVDGVPHLSSPEVPGWGAEAHPFRLVEVLGSGSVHGGLVFGEPVAVAQDSTGNRYVLDRQAPGVHVIDPDGNLVRTIGREGEGPGEFSRPSDLIVFEEGVLAVLDPGNLRISLFGMDGEFLDQLRAPEFLSQFEPRSEGGFFAYPRPRYPNLRVLPNELETDSKQIVVLSPRGEEVGEFATRHPLTGEMMDVHLNKVFLATLPGDSLVLSYQNQAQMEVWTPEGELARVVHRSVPFQPDPPRYGEQDRGPGLRPFIGNEWSVLSSGLAVHPLGGLWAVLVPQEKAVFRTPMFGDAEIPARWSIDLYSADGLWLARQPLDMAGTYAVLDWHTDGLYLINGREDAAVYRFAYQPPVGVTEGG